MYGSGAALLSIPQAPVFFAEVPKNEIQYRARAGSISCLGESEPYDHKKMYKACPRALPSRNNDYFHSH